MAENMHSAFAFAFFIAGCLTFDSTALNIDDPRLTYAREDNGTLTEEPFGAENNVRFELFTLTNPSEAQIISPLNITTIEISNFNASNPTRIFVHGWRSEGLLTPIFADAYLVRGKHNVNFIAVNWYEGATEISYLTARQLVNSVGLYLARFIDVLVRDVNVKLSDVQIVGHSLGAHISGMAGKNITNGKVGKIVGLDPALPLFEYNSTALRLHHDDADYVESIHSSGLGFFKSIGQASFYPNGGRRQPGCPPGPSGSDSCSHSRAHQLFLESLYSNIMFHSIGCGSLESVTAGKCNLINDTAVMGGEPGILGNVRGIYYLQTNDRSPFARGRPHLFD